LQFVLIGIGVGGILALAAGKWLQPLLFMESARDPVVFALVIVVLIVVALIATMVPATKAAGVDPNLTLKAE
jgi:ABC-type antimicrobial peptide transport system permease subunit